MAGRRAACGLRFPPRSGATVVTAVFSKLALRATRARRTAEIRAIRALVRRSRHQRGHRRRGLRCPLRTRRDRGRTQRRGLVVPVHNAVHGRGQGGQPDHGVASVLRLEADDVVRDRHPDRPCCRCSRRCRNRSPVVAKRQVAVADRVGVDLRRRPRLNSMPLVMDARPVRVDTDHVGRVRVEAACQGDDGGHGQSAGCGRFGGVAMIMSPRLGTNWASPSVDIHGRKPDRLVA